MKGFLEKINFSRYSMRERLLMLGSYLLAVLVLFNLVFYPKQKEAGRLEERVKTLQSDIQTLSKTLQEYQQKAMTLSKNPASSGTQEPSKIVSEGDRISTVLRKVTAMAIQEDVELEIVRPEVVEEKEEFLHLVVQIETKSRFLNLLQYLEKLEGLSEPFTISDIKMQTNVEISPFLRSKIVAKVLVWRGT
ncbi:MAG TPA: hypothetical protein VGB26_13040 [Nitrospiria bacterium]|jgi:Tfp pilus assembly protein PilO